ncbi:Growth factor receptor-bound protein 2 [Cichlidogyrus casuarinus]|uniref:Growth factor receptor-bound protein 2 n=1 Tax=Cichlidogyrus casuarinus TaxID=1844966 RepID=A0ABD2QGI8_9PLAT
MEAKALHSFVPENSDELAFREGSTVYIINMDEEPSWYRGRQNGKEGLVPKNYLRLDPNSWFVPNCSRLEAEARLAEKDLTGNYIQPDGAFILRHSENNPGSFSISVKEGVFVLHFRVFYEEPGSYFIWTSKFSSINKLIDHHRHSTIYGLRTLLLKDCIRSENFGPDGAGSPYKGPQATTVNNGNTGMRNQAAPFSGVSQRSIPRTDRAPAVAQLPPGLQTSDKTGHICVALFDFRPDFTEEMGFLRGDMIEILAEEDENWWLGRMINHKTGLPLEPLTQGLFPSNYVKMLPSNSAGGK